MPNTLITGATGGIGYALARQYAARGHNLIMVGRRELSTLESDFFNQNNYCQTDLADCDSADRIADHLQQRGVTSLDLLIHNAGIGYFGGIAEQSAENIAQIIQVNLRTPVMLTHRLMPLLMSAGGRIVMISSVVANLPAPEYAVYTATKAALDSFAYNLAIELHSSPVSVEVVRPGATNTDMHRKLGIPATRMNPDTFPSADSVATQIISAIERGGEQHTLGAGNRIMRFVGKHLAGVVDQIVKRRAQ